MLSVMRQFSDAIEHFDDTVASIKQAIDATDWDVTRKQLAQLVISELPTPNKLSNWMITCVNGAFFKALEITFNFNNFKQAEYADEKDAFRYVDKYMPDLLSDISAFSSIKFTYGGRDAFDFPEIIFYIAWEF